MTQKYEVWGEYHRKFGVNPPFPIGPSDETVAAVLKAAIESGKPVPDDYDWWADLPPGADS